MIRGPSRSTRTDTRLPYTTPYRYMRDRREVELDRGFDVAVRTARVVQHAGRMFDDIAHAHIHRAVPVEHRTTTPGIECFKLAFRHGLEPANLLAILEQHAPVGR